MARILAIAAGNRVTTQRGVIAVESLKAGDEVWTRRKWQPVTIIQPLSEPADVVAIQLSNGQRLTGTADVKVLSNRKGWRKLIQLSSGDFLNTAAYPDSGPVSVVKRAVKLPGLYGVYHIGVDTAHELLIAGVTVHDSLGTRDVNTTKRQQPSASAPMQQVPAA